MSEQVLEVEIPSDTVPGKFYLVRFGDEMAMKFDAPAACYEKDSDGTKGKLCKSWQYSPSNKKTCKHVYYAMRKLSAEYSGTDAPKEKMRQCRRCYTLYNIDKQSEICPHGEKQ